MSEGQSWWVGVPREDFTRLRREHEPRMINSKFGTGTLYSNLGDSVPRPRKLDREFAPRPQFEAEF